MRSKPPLKILLVEDSPIVIKSHTKILAHIGYIVEVAEDGQKALMMGQGDYDLIFMDISLPYLSGFEVTSRLRQLGIKKPIIGLTAYDKHEVETDCLACGMNTVLVKPMRQDQLQSVVETYVYAVSIISTSLSIQNT